MSWKLNFKKLIKLTFAQMKYKSNTQRTDMCFLNSGRVSNPFLCHDFVCTKGTNSDMNALNLLRRL